MEIAAGGLHRCSPARRPVLATVFFNDIVSSTDRLTTLRDERWREVMDAHDRLVDQKVTPFGGRVVHGTGDGVLAIFDGPTRAIRAAQAVMARGSQPSPETTAAGPKGLLL